MNISLNIKIKYISDVFLSVKSTCMNDYTCRCLEKNYKSNGFLNFNKNNENFRN